MTKQIIFYGAGQNAREHLAEWETRGFIPVCFADEDKEKHNTKFHTSGLDILSLVAAVWKYPNHEIYVTPTREKRAGIVTSLLERGVEASAIRFFGPVEYRKGRPNMGTCFILGNKAGCCCVPDYRENFDFVS